MTSISLELQNKVAGLLGKYMAGGIIGYVWNPVDHVIYLDNPSKKAEAIDYKVPVLNSLAWAKANNLVPATEAGKAAAALIDDPLSLKDCFYSPFDEVADYMMQDISEAKEKRDRGLAASVITSRDYATLQDPIVLGESIDTIFPGVLLQLWEDVPTPQLKGDWLNLTNGVDYFTNVPEGMLPEPTKGVGSRVTIEVPKHAGGIAITERAEAMINNRNIYQQLSQALGRKRLMRENGLVAAELENSTNVIAGVDFGLRAGTPPSSSNVPNDMFQTIIDAFQGLGGTFNAVASKNIVFNEYKNNDFNKGFYSPTGSVTPADAVSPAPGVDGVTWFRDQAIVLATKLWAMDRNLAGKNFRGPVRAFDIDSPKTESRETWLKSYLLPKIVDNNFIREVTGVQA